MSAASMGTDLGRFYDDVARHNLQPLWTQTSDLMPHAPRPTAVPWLWPWSTLRPLAERAGELVPVERGGERRVLALSNPGLGGAPYATPSLWAAVQYLGPRESAPAHRHTAGAIRFVLEGAGVWTTVNGDACDMHPGDLVLTPSWCWHDHENGGDAPMLWFDGLDLPLSRYLDAIFYENHPDLKQPIRGRNLSERRPGDRRDGDRLTPPLLVYRWETTDAELDAILAAGATTASVRFTDPHTGRDVLPTMACSMQRVLPGACTGEYRKVGSSVFVVFRGSGTSFVEGTRMDWKTGDMFAVPSWSTVQHEATEAADLFSISDEPAMRALGLFREEHVARQST